MYRIIVSKLDYYKKLIKLEIYHDTPLMTWCLSNRYPINNKAKFKWKKITGLQTRILHQLKLIAL